MADIYCYHGGSNTSPYDTWAKAATTFATAMSATAAGDRVLLASDHVETGTSGSWSSNGTEAQPVRIVSAERTGTTYSKAAAAQLDFSSVSNIFGSNVFIGVWIKTGGTLTISGSGLRTCRYLDCTLETTAITATWKAGGQGSMAFLDECTLNNSAASGTISLLFELSGSYASIAAKGCTITAGTTVTDLVKHHFGASGAIFIGCDLGGAPFGSAINPNTVDMQRTELINCRMPSGFSVSTARSTQSWPYSFRLHNCDSANTVTRAQEQEALGDLATSTSIYRTAGAYNGATHFSLQITSQSNTLEWCSPYRVKLADLWLDTSSAKTLTVHVARDGTATPIQDDEAWIEVAYPDDTTAAYHWQDDRAATITATPADQADSTEPWTGLGGTNKRQKLEVTTSNTGKAGPVQVFLCLAKPSTTLYACPKVEVT